MMAAVVMAAHVGFANIGMYGTITRRPTAVIVVILSSMIAAVRVRTPATRLQDVLAAKTLVGIVLLADAGQTCTI